MHVEDELFLNSLLQPMKKKELNDAIDKLKQVIESSNLTALAGSSLDMSLRQVLRKLELLRLDVTLREYRKGNSIINTKESESEIEPPFNKA
eukprot:263491_1